MYSRLIIIALFLFAAYLLVRWFIRTPPQQVTRQVKKSGLYIIIAIVAVLAVTGKLHWLFALFAGLIPFAQRLFGLLRSYQMFKGMAGQFKNMSGMGNRGNTQSSGQQSTITTAWLKVSLDHDSGDLSGMVLEGRFRGKHLEEMPIDELILLLADCRTQDEESAPLLETYLDRRFGEQWREQFDHQSTSNQQQTANGADISIKEAYDILGLAQNASADEIKQAHKRLIQKLHPDRGGSPYLAAKINKSKDILMAHLACG